MSEPELEPLHRNRARADSFGAVAEAYDRTRPDYPPALLDDLARPGTATAIDVGCGTGILARQLAARGLDVLGVEPDPKMAGVARGHGLSVEVSRFEDWDPGSRRFDLLTSAQAWHWVEPVAGAAKAAAVVAPGGRVALIWNISTMPDALRDALDDVYGRVAPPSVRPTVLHRPEAWKEHGSAEDEFVRTGAFDEVDHHSYPWTRAYDKEQWVGQLTTHSDHRLLDDERRERLLDAVGSAIDDLGGSFVMHYDCHASVLVRR